MNTHPLDQQLDTIDHTVTDHNALLTSALAEDRAQEALISSLQHQFERHTLTANLQSYTSIQRDIIDTLRFHRTQRREATAYPVLPAITAVAIPTLTSPDRSRTPENGRYSFYAVRKGRRTDIVYSWVECHCTTQRIANEYRGFNTFKEAIEYINLSPSQI
jgi:hypothetical protein